MDVLSNLQKLPEVCAVYHPTTNEPVLVRRGEPGYYEVLQTPGFSVEKFNYANGVSSPQQSAMLHGCMFGWSVPAADVDNPINQKELDKSNKGPRSATITTITGPDTLDDAGIREMAQRLAPGGK